MPREAHLTTVLQDSHAVVCVCVNRVAICLQFGRWFCEYETLEGDCWLILASPRVSKDDLGCLQNRSEAVEKSVGPSGTNWKRIGWSRSIPRHRGKTSATSRGARKPILVSHKVSRDNLGLSNGLPKAHCAAKSTLHDCVLQFARCLVCSPSKSKPLAAIGSRAPNFWTLWKRLLNRNHTKVSPQSVDLRGI